MITKNNTNPLVEKESLNLKRGVIMAVSAYLFWGLHPVYWKLLNNVPAEEIVSHRIIWSLIFFVLIITIRKKWTAFGSKLRANPSKWSLFMPAFLIGSNWAIYIWAVNANYVIETSLGYFICPLVSVFLGVFFLRENLRKLQWLSVIIACSGVLIMTFIYGQFPWISIFLASTWGLYGLIRKRSPLNAIEGLTLETAVLFIPAIIFLIYQSKTGVASFFNDTTTSLLLIGTGIISGLPLIIFIESARLINLSIIGILQYIYPILIFIIGVAIYNEPLTETRIVGLAFIWSALLIFIIDGLLTHHGSSIMRHDNGA